MLFGPKFASFTFSDHALKIATGKITSKGVKIYFLSRKELPKGIVLNGEITNTNLFREALKAFFLENYDRLGTRNLLLGLNEQDVYLRGFSFEEEPKNLIKTIRGQVTPKLPFDQSKANILYHEISKHNYQVIVSKPETITLLSSVFTEVGFSLKAVVPIPLIFPKLVGYSKVPYLFVSSEENNLVYGLVVKNMVVFSSTEKLEEGQTETEKEVVRTAKEIIEEEYGNNVQEPLRLIYISGRGAEVLKGFFAAQKYVPKVVTPYDKSQNKTSYEMDDFNQVISLFFYDESVPSIRKEVATYSTTPSGSTKKQGGLKYLVFLLAFLSLAAASYFLWPNLKEIFNQINQSKTTSDKTLISTQSQKPKTATGSSEKNQATASAKPQEKIDKKDYKIQVLNGTGQAGVANNMRDFLVSKGYTVLSIGNAANFNYEKTTLKVKTSKQEITSYLTKDLKERYSIYIDSPLLEGEKYDVLVIVGGE